VTQSAHPAPIGLRRIHAGMQMRCGGRSLSDCNSDNPSKIALGFTITIDNIGLK